MSTTRARSPSSCAPTRASPGSTMSASPTAPIMSSHKNISNGRAPSLLTFGVVGGLDAAKAFYDALKLVKRLVNIGDTRTLCCHPASTTHRQMTPEEQMRAGVRAETHPPQRRHRAHRRHSGRSRPGARRRPLAGRNASPRSSPMPLTIEQLAPTRPSITDLGERRIRRGTIRDRGRRIRIGLVNNMPDAALRGDRAAIRQPARRGQRRLRRSPRAGQSRQLPREPGVREAIAERLSRARRPARPAPRRDHRHRRRTARARTQRRALLARARQR